MMRGRLAAVALLMSVSTLGCGGGTTISTAQSGPSISVSPQSAVVPVNTTLAINAKVACCNASIPAWTVNGSPNGSASSGTLNVSSGVNVVYTAPATPPVYLHTDPSQQGRVEVEGYVSGIFGSATGSSVLTITAPTVTTGIDPAAITLPLSTNQVFYGYAVGATNNSVVFQVNGVTGGSAATGFISNATGSMGTYSSPFTLPPTGNTVTITVVSVADPTRSSSAAVTLR